VRCNTCEADNREGARFCDKCGAKLPPLCPSCGAENRPNAKFCDSCGSALTATVAASSVKERNESSIRITKNADVEAVDGERKTVTALFADIKGSMELMEALDPEEARAIVDPALKLMIDAVHRYDGYIVQSTGDGIFALFGAPVAYEDHPQRALYSALRMQDEMRRFAERLRAEKGINLQVRIGANVGEVVVRSIQTGERQVEYTPIGHSTGLASRLQTLANPGSIAISDSLRKLVEGYFMLRPLGPARIRGSSEPVEVYEVTGLGPLRTRLQRAAGRGLTRFVGRDREMEALRHAAGMAREGHGQIVAVMAEPGIGKSRLFYEFKVTNSWGWMVLEAFSISHGKASPYLPVIDFLSNYFRIARGDDERTRREKVAGRIAILDRSLEDALPYLFSLFGIAEGKDPQVQMDGQMKKRRTLDGIKRILLCESINQPLMLVFEDLHWIDGESRALLDLIADSISNAHILVLVNYRPEVADNWGDKTYYRQLRLDPLGRESAQEMLEALLGRSTDMEGLKRLIIEKTEGNPFFIEEIVQGLVEEGVLARNTGLHLTKSLREPKIPATVQAMLASRIDRLPSNEKELLQTLAVLGREFSLSHLQATSGTNAFAIEGMLADLQSGDFISEQPTGGDSEYIFKHALTQEVAYNSILSERRKALHERAGKGLELIFAANLADHYDNLAHHYRLSGNVSKAIEYLGLAAEQAMNRSGFEEAGEQIKAALEILVKQPDGLERDRTEIALRFRLAVCVNFSVVGAFASATISENLERARDLCVKLGDESSLMDILAGLAFVYANRPERQKADAICKELLALATKTGNPEMAGRARSWLGFSPFWAGDFSEAVEQLEQARKLPAGRTPRWEVTLGSWRIINRSIGSLAWWMSGYPDRAITISRESLAVAREKGEYAPDLVPALFWSATLCILLRDLPLANAQTAESFRLAHEYGLGGTSPAQSFYQGWTLVLTGNTEAGLSQMEDCWNQFVVAKQSVIGPWMAWVLGDAYLAAGRASAGLVTVNEGIELAERTGAKLVEAELRRLKGELLLVNCGEPLIEPVECFRAAIDLARRQNAKSWELRATVSLARLLARHGRRDEARAMLVEIYDWFTEGFDTADLKDAKALLYELSS
jgi:class 3 adenylate cyclase/tetratricopeptide (TPR) repeat protein